MIRPVQAWKSDVTLTSSSSLTIFHSESRDGRKVEMVSREGIVGRDYFISFFSFKVLYLILDFMIFKIK